MVQFTVMQRRRQSGIVKQRSTYPLHSTLLATTPGGAGQCAPLLAQESAPEPAQQSVTAYEGGTHGEEDSAVQDLLPPAKGSDKIAEEQEYSPSAAIPGVGRAAE